MPSTAQDRNFKQMVGLELPDELLSTVIEWIKSNLEPDDVFDEKELKEWANNYDPEGIFRDDQLESWAESNGYTKE